MTKLVMKANLPQDIVAAEVTKMNVTNDAVEHEAHVAKLAVTYDKAIKQRRGKTDPRGAMTRTARSVFVGSVRAILGLDAERIASFYSGRVQREDACREIDQLVAYLGEIKKALSQ